MVYLCLPYQLLNWAYDRHVVHAGKPKVRSSIRCQQSQADSDRYDIGNGKRERGLQTLANIRGDGDINNPAVRAEYEEIIAAVGEFDLFQLFGVAN